MWKLQLSCAGLGCRLPVLPWARSFVGPIQSAHVALVSCVPTPVYKIPLCQMGSLRLGNVSLPSKLSLHLKLSYIVLNSIEFLICLKVYLGRMPICWRWRLFRSSCWPSKSRKQLVSLPPKSTTWKLFCQTSEGKISSRVCLCRCPHKNNFKSFWRRRRLFSSEICFAVKTKCGKTQRRCWFFFVR